MTAILTAPLRRLSRALFDLRDRVREALAGEVARAVGEAVREIVAVVLRGGPPPAAPSPGNDSHPGRSHWTDPDADPWGDHQAPWHDDRDGTDFDREPDDVEQPDPPPSVPRTPAGLGAAAAGLSAGRWWLGRRGSVAEAVGVGVIVGLAVLAGGPLARAGAAVVSAAADVSAATDALGSGAARLNRL